MEIEVWKFGGASLTDGRGISRAAARIAAHRGPLVVVASAMAGVTDLLLDAAPHAADALRRTHDRAARTVLGRGPALTRILKQVDASAREFRDLRSAAATLGHVSPRVRDVLVARGERLAALLLAAAVSRARRRATTVDALDVVCTDAGHGGATVHLAETTTLARRVLLPLLRQGRVVVVPGFLGRAPDGSVTTLGRGGSDLTATVLARSLGARTVVLWKDVPGILTADPRLVPDARLIPQLHHREAAEVAHYGAQVLHPRALIPLSGTRIALQVRSFFDPERPGTEVSARQALKGYPVKAIAILPAQAVVTVSGTGMMGVHGIAARTFAAMEAEGLSVSTIFQASSESSIGFTLPEAAADRAVRRLRQAFQPELAQAVIDGVRARPGMSVVAVVGEGMVGTPGIAARVFSALEGGGINVIAIAQGSSERNISFVVAGADAPESARRVHAAFQLSKIGGGRPVTSPHTDVVLLGFGRVGRALADQIARSPGGHRARIVGLLDRSGFVFDPRGISRARLLKLARDKDAGRLLADLGGRPAPAHDALVFMADHAVSRPVVVDVTSDQTADLLRSAMAHGFDVVLANKKPLAGSWAHYEHLTGGATGRRLRYEATVGAGLPIIDTFHKLTDTGDRVRRIDGCVSGTLMYVLSEVSAGRAFSSAVREAVDRGYAEPDPREDLSGRDAARKALILARMLGFRGAAPAAEDLVPAALRPLALADFLERLPELDEPWRDRVAMARARGRVLRYVVSASLRTVKAGLMEVPASDAMAAAGGTRNIVTFHSLRYQREPLVISGPGAGAEVTAAGILNDIRSLGAR
jgi:aspartokinase/homoserine dehydrogenase 1